MRTGTKFAFLNSLSISLAFCGGLCVGISADENNHMPAIFGVIIALIGIVGSAFACTYMDKPELFE